MPKPSSPLERCNAVLRAFDTPFRLRQHRRSQWVTVYEILPGRCTKERSMRGYPAADATALERLCNRVLEASKQGLALDAVVEPEVNAKRPSTSSPCWPEICQAVVAFQRGQGVNMNLVGPFKGQGYFRLLPQDRPVTLEDVRRFALHTTESLKEQLEDPSAVLLPMATHRQGFRQKREVGSLLRRAGFGTIAPQELSEELKGMVNRKKLALVAAGQSRRRIPSTAAIEEWLGAVCCHKLRSNDAKAEFELKTKLYAWVEVAEAEGRKKAQKRKERCVPYDLRHAYAIRARETTSWSYADVAAVMGHSPEVHRRTYLSEISGEQTKAAVVRRLLGDEQVA